MTSVRQEDGYDDANGTEGIVGNEYLRLCEQNEHTGGTIKTVIKDIDNVLHAAHEKGKLFSEVGTAWARKSVIFDLKNYKKFPTNARF